MFLIRHYAKVCRLEKLRTSKLYFKTSIGKLIIAIVVASVVLLSDTRSLSKQQKNKKYVNDATV